MEWQEADIDSELKKLDSVVAAFGASSPEGNDHMFWRGLLREVDACTEGAVKLLAQAAIQHEEERSRGLMERLDRLDVLAGSIRLRLSLPGAKPG